MSSYQINTCQGMSPFFVIEEKGVRSKVCFIFFNLRIVKVIVSHWVEVFLSKTLRLIVKGW